MDNQLQKKTLVKQIDYDSDEEVEENSDNESNDDFFAEKKLKKKLEISPEEFREKKKLLKSAKGLKNLQKQIRTEQTVTAFETITNLNPIDTFNNIDDFTINIRVSQRNSKKYTTTIENIPSKFFENKDTTDLMIKKMRDILASRATIKKDIIESSDNKINYIIEVSGNKVHLMIPIIQEYTNCSLSNIKVHGYN